MSYPVLLTGILIIIQPCLVASAVEPTSFTLDESRVLLNTQGNATTLGFVC